MSWYYNEYVGTQYRRTAMHRVDSQDINGLTDNLLYDNIASATFAFESYGTRDALEGGLVKSMNEGLLPSLVSVIQKWG